MSGPYMVFDVESIGLHGEGFAVGYVVVDGDGKELEARLLHCDPDKACGTGINRKWIAENVPVLNPDHGICTDPMVMRQAFWMYWQYWKERGVTLWAGCAWPVEARFLAQCVGDDIAAGEWQGPYPLHEIATLALACGHDPTATVERLPDELPAHNPLNDARQSARLLVQYLGELQAVQA